MYLLTIYVLMSIMVNIHWIGGCFLERATLSQGLMTPVLGSERSVGQTLHTHDPVNQNHPFLKHRFNVIDGLQFPPEAQSDAHSK